MKNLLKRKYIQSESEDHLADSYGDKQWQAAIYVPYLESACF